MIFAEASLLTADVPVFAEFNKARNMRFEDPDGNQVVFRKIPVQYRLTIKNNVQIIKVKQRKNK